MKGVGGGGALDLREPHESGQRTEVGEICNTGSLPGSGREQQTFQSNNIPLNLKLQADFVFFLPCDWHCLTDPYSSKPQNSLIYRKMLKELLVATWSLKSRRETLCSLFQRRKQTAKCMHSSVALFTWLGNHPRRPYFLDFLHVLCAVPLPRHPLWPAFPSRKACALFSLLVLPIK